MSKSFFYQPLSNLYRYWLKDTKLLLQIAKKDMDKFRVSSVGKQVERHADIFQIGGGWYEISAKEGAFEHFPAHIQEIVTPKAGHKVWLAAFNAHHIGDVKANPTPFFVERVRPGGIVHTHPVYQPPSQHRLQALASHFAR